VSPTESRTSVMRRRRSLSLRARIMETTSSG
jgi:hypothetical protein